MSPHYVYRCYDEAGALLYVGATADVDKRMAAHLSPASRSATSQQIRRRMVRHTIHPYASWDAALRAEKRAIISEHPELNVTFGTAPRAPKVTSEAPAGSTSRRITDFVKATLAARGMTATELADASGLSRSTLSRRLTHGGTWMVNDLEALAAGLGLTVLDLFAERAA